MTDQETPLYQIVPISGYGLGVTANAHISRGDLITSEAPLITVEGSSVDGISGAESSIASSLQYLPHDEQRAFRSLHNCYGDKLSTYLGIFKSNSLPLGTGSTSAGLFLQCSRFNHSCIPNAMFSWNPHASTGCIYAIQDISPDEQITISYLDPTTSQSPRHSRQLRLLASFDFECLCTACAQPPDSIEASDRRRRNIARMDEILDAGALVRSNPGKALGFCQRIVELWDEEGLDDLCRYKTYYDAFRICVMHGDLARASAFAALAVGVKEECEGGVGLEEVRRLVECPESHALAGVTGNWKTRRKHALRVGSEGFEEWLWGRAE